MATTQNTYTGNGSTTTYSFTFPYLNTTDIKVSLDAVDTTAYTLSNATTVTFTTAPTSGAAIRIYRDTNSDNLNATFYPGSAIRSSDLNNNFTQNLYVTQEADFNVDISNGIANTAKTTADTALTNSAAAVTTANAAETTANTADTNASAAVTTANAANATATTASTDAASAIATANTASTNASAAVTTANSAATDAATAITTANGAVTTANAATTAATNAQTDATSATNTANTASTNASNAVTTANAANTTAGTASTNATTALNTANAASAAVSNAVLFTLIANVAAIPGSPSNNDYVEMGDSTGVESFSPLSGVPSGFVGASGLTVRLRYDSSATSWVWMSYYANDSEDRYLTKNIPVVTGDATNGSGQITLNCENNSHGVKIKGPPHSAAASYTLTLPNDTGTSGYVLKTDGSGTTSWGGADVVFDTSPTLGGDLDVGVFDISKSDSSVFDISNFRVDPVSSNKIGQVYVSGAQVASIGTRGSATQTTNWGSEFRMTDTRMDMYFGGNHTLHMANSGNFEITRSGAGITFGAFGSAKTEINPHSNPTGNTTYYLPAADGTANQVLTTDGSGNMSWSNGGSPTIDAGNFDSGGSLVTTSQTFDGGSFD